MVEGDGPSDPVTGSTTRSGVGDPMEPDDQNATVTDGMNGRPSTAESSDGATRSMAGRSARTRILGWTMIAAGVLLLAGTAWVGWRTYQAYSHLSQAAADVTALQVELGSVTDDNPPDASATLAHLQAESAAARSATDDPVYRLASLIPLIGPNLDAISDVSVTVDGLSTDVLPPLTEVARTLRPAQLKPTDGAIALEPVQRISPVLEAARGSLEQAQERMASIDRAALVQPVSDAVGTLQRKLQQADEVIDPAARIARLLPAMLGAEGPRTFMVAFQNLAEPRATGGMFGSFAIVQADHGRVTILDQGTARSMGFFDPPITELAEHELAIYSPLMAQYPADVNFTPDFPTASRLFLEMYRARTGQSVDGLLAIDPVALSYLLEGAPPIDVGDGVAITADNIVGVLLSTVYQEYDEADQAPRDAFLANATAVVFQEVMSGEGDPRTMLDGLRRAVSERRLLVYSNAEDEQSDIAQTTLAGGLDTGTTGANIGVYLNDGTAAKLGYYLSSETHVAWGNCRSDGWRELRVRVVLHYSPPADGLPAYVTGSSAFGQAYRLRTNVLVFAPLGGSMGGATRDGAPVGIGWGEDHSRTVGTVTVEMSPGDSTELEYIVLVPERAADTATPELSLTPGVTPWVTSVQPYELCSPQAG